MQSAARFSSWCKSVIAEIPKQPCGCSVSKSRGISPLEAGRIPPELSAEAECALLGYPWPGNVRQLRNTVERAVILAPGRRLTPEAFPERIAHHGGSAPVVGGDFTVDDLEREVRPYTDDDHVDRVGTDVDGRNAHGGPS